ncbi:MAG: flagellar hook protein FlgE [Methylococcaceae bacterium]|nr:MAG: flagellar hook protein FlgE [Methylococcaceae bacterium]
MSFTTGLSGLSAAQNLLSVTGNNVANVNTTGFKLSRAEFSDVYATSVGSVSKTAPGSGAKVANDAQQFSQGNLQFTENSLDMAVTGEGFFVLGGSIADPTSGVRYTRDGAFHLDSDGYVVSNSGNPLLAYRPNDAQDATAGFSTGIRDTIRVNTSQSNPSATTEVKLGLNVSSNALPPTVAEFSTLDPNSYNYATSVNIFDSLGVQHTVTSYFVKAPSDDPAPQAVDVNGNSIGGAVWKMYVDVDDSGGKSVGGDAPTGQPLSLTEGVTAANPIYLEFDTSGNLVPPALGDNEQNNSLTTPAVDADGAPIDPPVPGPVINFTPTSGAAPISFTMNMTGSTQFSTANSVNTLTQDGYATGNLTGVAVDESGVMYARYSNGSSTVLGEVALAKFQNPQALSKLGDTGWAESTTSGVPIYGEAGIGSFGKLHSGALEGSNVDLASELVKLIIAQQMYQANTQSIQTENTVTNALLQLR